MNTMFMSPPLFLIYQRKNATKGDVLSLVTSVDQTWNSVLEGLERIDTAVEELVLEGEE